MQPTLNIRAKTLHLHLAPTSELSAALLASVKTIAPAANIAERFVLSHDDQIVTDHKTGLMWPVYESEQAMNYDAAEKYAAALRLGGFDDWFTPSAEQRESIRDLSRHAPALFEPFKSRSNDWEWTSTPVAWRIENGSPSAFWQVYGDGGSLSGDDRDNEAFARPCRFVARAGQ